MDREPLRTLIARCGATLLPGEVFVDGDLIYEGACARLDGLTRRPHHPTCPARRYRAHRGLGGIR
jgi:hypothetical protein